MLLEKSAPSLFPEHFSAKLSYVTSTRLHKNMSLFYGETTHALDNRREFLRSLNIDSRDLVCAKQVHGSRIKCAQDKDKGKGALDHDSSIPGTDALVTNCKDLPLAVFTADCLCVFLYDPQKNAIGLAHAGWRGSAEKITLKTAQSMQAEFGSRSQDLYAGFSPAIRSCCYEVGEEFPGIFPEGVARKDGHYYLDLMKLNRAQLVAAGLQDKNIFDPAICTSCDNGQYFSYRKEGKDCGRMMSVMMLK